MDGKTIHSLVMKHLDTAIELRRKIHQFPELEFQEKNTADCVIRALRDLSVPIEKGIAQTGVVAVIGDMGSRRGVLIRADMDALLIEEKTSLPFASQNPGVMHACGHDAHIAAAVLAGKVLNEIRDELSGAVYLVFQPAEEGMGGAQPMIDDGILERYPSSYAVAGHMMPEIPVGKVMIKPGPIMASPDDFEITFCGKGGHGAMPESAINPILMCREFIAETESIMNSVSAPDTPCAISICSVHAGTSRIAIPETAKVSGTFRTLTPETRRLVTEKIKQSAERIAASHGGNAHSDINLLYPPLVNDGSVTEKLIGSAQSVVGKDNVLIRTHASMLGDDFAYFAERLPSVYFHIGCGDDTRTAPLHSPYFDLNEDAIRIAAELYVQFALDCLN